MLLQELNLPQLDLELARTMIQNLIESENFELAGIIAYRMGREHDQYDLRVEACKLFYLANMHQQCIEAVTELSDTANAPVELLTKLLAISLVAIGQTQNAKQALTFYSSIVENEAWVPPLLSEPELSIELLALMPLTKANIEHAGSYSESNRLRIKLNLLCTNCGCKYERTLRDSPFQIRMLPCECCFHPWTTYPLSVADSLSESISSYDTREAVGLDLFLWSWVHRWFRENDDHMALNTNWGANLGEGLYFTLRCALGEVYTQIHLKQITATND